MEHDEILKKIKSIMEKTNKNSHSESKIKFNEDELNFKVLERMVPYFDNDNKKNILFLLKLNEINSIIKKYENINTKYDRQEKNWKKGLLLAIKPELSDENKSTIDMAIKLLEYKELLNLHKTLV